MNLSAYLAGFTEKPDIRRLARAPPSYSRRAIFALAATAYGVLPDTPQSPVANSKTTSTPPG